MKILSMEIDAYSREETTRMQVGGGGDDDDDDNKRLLQRVQRQLVSTGPTVWTTVVIVVAALCYFIAGIGTATPANNSASVPLTHQSSSNHYRNKPSPLSSSSSSSSGGQQNLYDYHSPSALTMVHEIYSNELIPLELILDSNYYVLIFFYKHWSQPSRDIRPLWKRAAIEGIMGDDYESLSLASFVAMVELDCEVYPEACQSHNITAVPSIRFYTNSGEDTAFLYYDDRDGEFQTGRGILQNLNHYLGEKFADNSDDPDWFKDNGDEEYVDLGENDDVAFGIDRVKNETGKHVTDTYDDWNRTNGGALFFPVNETISGYRLDELLLGGDHSHVFVFFVSPGCQKCNDLSHDWEQLIKAGGFHNVLLLKVDCSAGDNNTETYCQTHNMTEFPTFRLYHKGIPDMPDYRHEEESWHGKSFVLLGMRSFLAKKMSAEYGYPISRPSKYRVARHWNYRSTRDFLINTYNYDTAKNYQENVVISFTDWSDNSIEPPSCYSLRQAYNKFAKHIHAATANPKKELLVLSTGCRRNMDCPHNESPPFVLWYHNGELVEQLNWELAMTVDTLMAVKDRFIEKVNRADREESNIDRFLQERGTALPVRRHLPGVVAMNEKMNG